jgi:hypothetical protein
VHFAYAFASWHAGLGLVPFSAATIPMYCTLSRTIVRDAAPGQAEARAVSDQNPSHGRPTPKNKTQVLDAIRERKAPFSPEGVVEEFAALIKSYRCSKLSGDKYAGEWPQDLLHTMRKGEVGIVSRLATLSSIPAQSIFWSMQPIRTSP